MEMHKKLAAIGLTAGLLGGGAAGAVLGTSGISGAEPIAVVQDDSTEAPAEDGDRPDKGQFLAEALAPLVEAGTLTQAQADAVVETLQEARPEGQRGHGGPGHKGGESAAEALGITTDELRDALKDGATIAEVAALQGVDVQTVIDAMVAEAATHLSEKVAEGDLTQEEADEKLAEITERSTERVNNGRPEGGDGHGPRGARGPGGPGQGADQGADEGADEGEGEN